GQRLLFSGLAVLLGFRQLRLSSGLTRFFTRLAIELALFFLSYTLLLEKRLFLFCLLELCLGFAFSLLLILLFLQCKFCNARLFFLSCDPRFFRGRLILGLLLFQPYD